MDRPHSATAHHPVPDHADLAVMDERSGTLVHLSASAERGRLRLQRLLVFLADGMTLWWSAEHTDDVHLPELAWDRSDRTERVRVFARTSVDLEPAEHLATAGPATARTGNARVPVTLDLALAPLSLPIPPARAHRESGLAGTQVQRVTGTISAGSVVDHVDGQAWVGASAFGAPANEGGVRVQIAFQDGSSMLATAPETPEGAGPGAVQEHTVTTPVGVTTLRVSGPKRRIPNRVICQIDADRRDTVIGSYRSLDQHVSMLRPSTTGEGWVRRAFTPFDFARSGVTGFGLLEHLEIVASPEAPDELGTGIPETF